MPIGAMPQIIGSATVIASRRPVPSRLAFTVRGLRWEITVQIRTLRRTGLVATCIALSVLAASCSSGASSSRVSTPGSTNAAVFASAVRRTIGALSFTMHLPGTTLTYVAPNLTSVTMQNPNHPSYPPGGYDAEGRSKAVAYLDLALALSVTGAHGNVYNVQGYVTGPPAILQALDYYPPKRQGAGCSSPATACGFLTNTYWHSDRHYLVTGRVTVDDEHVASETFVLHGFTRRGYASDGTVRYSGINFSVSCPPP
jgi:hypothetical protein